MTVSTAQIRDPHQWDDKGVLPKGVYFPASSAYPLYDYNPTGRPYCSGAYKNDKTPPVDSAYWCHRALPFVRSRKGPKNNDWIREARQQGFVAAAVDATSLSEVDALISVPSRSGTWVSNFPISTGNAVALYNVLHGASLGAHVVFKPNKWATRIPGSTAYKLNLPAVRSWAAAHLK